MSQAANIASDPSPSGLTPANGSLSRLQGILVVDDNEGIRTYLSVGLKASGLAVWLAASGHEALAVCREHGPAIDLLLLDVRMPGWDGPETLAAIRTLVPDTPCCFMSGDTGRYTNADLLGFGATAVLQKPFRLDELIAQLQRLPTPIARQDE